MAKQHKSFYINKDVVKTNTETVYINKTATHLIGTNENGDDLKLIISFLHLQNNYQCFSDWSKQDMNDFWNFYKKVHQYTWTQVYATARKIQKNGIAYTIIPVTKYPNPEFKNNLSQDITLFELRVDAKKRVHGFRNKSVFYLCWLDREHKITH
ncbi:MAG6450 family protein [Flavobacterium cerinum]|uniref:Uncharacterized protein n=1 Tax=Flavobacterium cerinum TaxID=2502784 RepID=A0ABY5IR29_9FLAO|nr:hypothetical protein [Flavobacterium cerinum]UUC45278.1 hypothetical protein NOX80_16830 [Flavobacterium cerinum]